MHISFPVMWDFGKKPSDGSYGPPVKDAGTIHVMLDLDESESGECEVVLRTSLHEVVEDFVAGMRTYDGSKPTGSIVRTAVRLREALLAAAKQLDEVL